MNIVWEGLINTRLISFFIILMLPLEMGLVAGIITLFLKKFNLIPQEEDNNG